MFDENIEFRAVQKCDNHVEFELVHAAKLVFNLKIGFDTAENESFKVCLN